MREIHFLSRAVLNFKFPNVNQTISELISSAKCFMLDKQTADVEEVVCGKRRKNISTATAGMERSKGNRNVTKKGKTKSRYSK